MRCKLTLLIFLIFSNKQKGEDTVYMYELLEFEPFFQTLSTHKTDSLHFGMSFLNKIHCDVKSVEIAKALRLTKGF
jgi:hypothetical protein